MSKVGLAPAYNDTKRPRLHGWVRRLMAFPFVKRERMAACFRECFEEMAMDDVLGVEEEFHDRFRDVVAYYRRFWLEQIGADMICQFDEANRTNNHAEAFHRGIACGVQVAHPQTLVLVQLLINVERDAVLRFDAQRSGKVVQQRDKRLDKLEASIAHTMKSYGNGLFGNDAEYLSAVAKLYVEYNHKVKTARTRNSTDVLKRVVDVRDVVVKALEDQNLVVFGEDEDEATNDAGCEVSKYVDADFNTEILFDSNGDEHENDQCSSPEPERSPSPWSEIPMEICPEECPPERRREATKPRPEDDASGKQAKTMRRRTLKRMNKKR